MNEIFAPSSPQRPFVSHRSLDDMKNVIGVCCRECSDAGLLDECDIPLFLTRYDMTDDKWDLSGDGFLDRGSASLADENMVGTHQLWHLIRPTDEIAALVNACTRDDIVSGLATTSNDRDLRVRQRG